MHLQMHQYKDLYNCPMSKKDYNKLLVDEGKVGIEELEE